MEHFGHRQGQECHRHTVLALADMPVAQLQIVSQEEGQQGQQTHEHTLDHHVDTHTAGKDSLFVIARFTLHQVGLGVFHTQCQRREGIGNEVDPQQVHGAQQRESHHSRHKHSHHLCQVGRKQELDCLTDIIVDTASLANGGHDGCKVIVLQHHICGTFGYVGTGDTHTHADIGRLDTGCVVHAVTGHSGDIAQLLPSRHNTHLVFGLHTRIHREVSNLLFKLLVAHLCHSGTGDCLRLVGNDAQLQRNCNGRIDMVARDHHGTHAGFLTLLDSCLHLRTHGVDHTKKTHKHQVVLDTLGRGILGDLVQRTVRSSQHAERTVCHTLVSSQHSGAVLIGQRQILTVTANVRTLLQNLVGSALGELQNPTVRLTVNGGHHLTHAVKGSLCHTGCGTVQLGLADTQRIGVVDQCTLGRLAHGLTLFGVEGCVRALCHCACQQLNLLAVVVHHRHLVLGQSTRLIRADDLRTTQRFHRRQALDDGLFLCHTGHTHRQHDGHHRCQTLGDSRNRQRHRNDKGIQNSIQRIADQLCTVKDDLEHEDEHADRQHQNAQDLGQFVQALLQRCGFLFGLCQHVRNLTHFGIHTRSHHNSLCTAVHDGTTHIHHVLAVAKGHVLAVGCAQRALELLRRYAFAGQSGFLCLERSGLDQTAVSRHGVTGLQHHDIAHHQVLVFDLLDDTVAHHLTGRCRHLLQGGDGLLCTAFLDHAQNSVQQYDRHDNDKLRKRFVTTVDTVDNDRHQVYGRRDHQHDDHGVDQLHKEALDHRHFLLLGQLVSAVLFQASLCFALGQTLRTRFNLAQNLTDVFKIIPHIFLLMKYIHIKKTHTPYAFAYVSAHESHCFKPSQTQWVVRMLVPVTHFCANYSLDRPPRGPIATTEL